MILYRDYFDEEETLIPYVSGEEHIREYLHLLDMLLEQYLSRGKDVDQDEDWPGGFAAVQAEVRNHIQRSPFLRYSDEKDPVFVMQIAMARSHLKKREAQTAGRVFLPLAEVRRIFELNDYELLALLLALAVQADAKYANLFAFLQHDIAQKLPTIGLLEALYHQTELRSMKNAGRLSAGGKMDLYMLELKRNMTHNMMQTPLILKPQMRSFLLEQKTEPVDGIDSILSIYREEGIPVFFPRELTSQVRIAYNWEDIQLEESQIRILRMACDRYKLRNRAGENWGLFRKNAYGNGISILLYGPPGTGKTMAAQIIANEVGIPLYRIDLSRVYSKYIGETEKNLSLIFDRAKDANIILFFDEADSLFSKRTEVSNANDRYSNSETAYLLQKMEEYNGISILATNLYQNFDNAFLRRITFAVHFERPDVETREYLWRTILPEEVPVEKNIDFRFLAEEFEVSGSNIKAILYNAAYMAAAQGRSVGMEHIVRSVKCELDKLGQMVNAADFGIYAGYLL